MELQNFIISRPSGRPVATDIRFNANRIKKPIIIFSHGFKGFKDWGHFPEVAKQFAEAGFFVVSFNFSHNGTTPDHPVDFIDLEAFGNNNYTILLDDLGAVIDFISTDTRFTAEIDSQKLFLWGHSVGGGISLLKAAEDLRVKKVLAWASIGDTERRANIPALADWERDGVIYFPNARTGQQLPVYFQFHTNFYNNRERLDLLKAAPKINVPVLFIHGTADETVNLFEVENLYNSMPDADFAVIEGAGHTFGGKHPWEENQLPEATIEALQISISFFNE